MLAQQLTTMLSGDLGGFGYDTWSALESSSAPPHQLVLLAVFGDEIAGLHSGAAAPLEEPPRSEETDLGCASASLMSLLSFLFPRSSQAEGNV